MAVNAQDDDSFFILGDKVRKARLNGQQRERSRAERTARNQRCLEVLYCKEDKISSGHVSLVATVNDEGNDAVESRWHHHYPHTGLLPRRQMQVADGCGLYCLSTHRISIRLH